MPTFSFCLFCPSPSIPLKPAKWSKFWLLYEANFRRQPGCQQCWLYSSPIILAPCFVTQCHTVLHSVTQSFTMSHSVTQFHRVIQYCVYSTLPLNILSQPCVMYVGGTGLGNDQMSDAIKIGEPSIRQFSPIWWRFQADTRNCLVRLLNTIITQGNISEQKHVKLFTWIQHKACTRKVLGREQ